MKIYLVITSYPLQVGQTRTSYNQDVEDVRRQNVSGSKQAKQTKETDTGNEDQDSTDQVKNSRK